MLLAAEELFSVGPRQSSTSPGYQSVFFDKEEDTLRWFLLPGDLLPGNQLARQTTPPFQPRLYLERGTEGVASPRSNVEDRPLSAELEGDKVGRGNCSESSEAEINEDLVHEMAVVSFHKPPRAVFGPTVQVCVCVCARQ